ncbi:MAG TPA: histidine kinase dimerization/phosphoacceptor domain -containing protein [Xanthobacteraceae bacterium]|nr:histidine kinase dimerization/phosphoacceptor domain -containing protein [Xanthobacteraceae bacterium]
MSLRFRLSVLVAAAVAPSLALISYNSFTWKDFLEADAGSEALASARLVSAEFNQLLEGTRRIMTTMMKHPAVPNDEEQCTAYFKSVIADLNIYREAAFIDRNGKFHCSTVPIPATLDVRDRVYFREPLETGQFTVGTLTVGRVTGETSIHVSMRYRSPDAGADGVVVLVLNPEKVAQEFEARQWPPQHRLTVFDRDGSVVLRVPRQQAAVGPDVRDRDIFERARDAPAGNFLVDQQPGDEEIVGFVPLKEAPQGLVVTVSSERHAALARLRAISLGSFIVGLTAIILAMIATWLVAHILIRRPVMAMVDTAHRREAGDTSAHFPKLRSTSELGLLSTALAGMSDKVDRLLEQKEFLLRELQHRVMNSLNILSSLLVLQSKHADEPAVRDQLSRAQQRILAMGSVYRYLYSADITARVEFGEFLTMICRESERAYVGGARPSIICETDKVEVSGNQAASLAMLAHELITNALKHAYPEGEAGPISVRLKRGKDGIVELSVADRGRGIPPDVSVDRPPSLGFKVIMATVRQFNARLEIRRLDPGSEILIRFPEDFGAPEPQQAEPPHSEAR